MDNGDDAGHSRCFSRLSPNALLTHSPFPTLLSTSPSPPPTHGTARLSRDAPAAASAGMCLQNSIRAASRFLMKALADAGSPLVFLPHDCPAPSTLAITANPQSASSAYASSMSLTSRAASPVNSPTPAPRPYRFSSAQDMTSGRRNSKLPELLTRMRTSSLPPKRANGTAPGTSLAFVFPPLSIGAPEPLSTLLDWSCQQHAYRMKQCCAAPSCSPALPQIALYFRPHSVLRGRRACPREAKRPMSSGERH